MIAKQAPRDGPSFADTFAERHFTLAETADMLRISREKALQQTGELRGDQASDLAREANMQLLDALNRLQSAERHFQQIYPCIQCVTDAKNQNGSLREVKTSGSEVKNAIADD